MTDSTAELVECHCRLAGFCEDKAVWGGFVRWEGVTEVDKHGVKETAQVSVQLLCGRWAVEGPSKDIWESS
jgi:hypothetical protein